jgi:lactoylglutathione lyase
MLRIKEPVRSLEFYQRALGMTLYSKRDFPQWKFSVYFLGMGRPSSEPPVDEKARGPWLFRQTGCIELTHNWGTEKDPDYAIHNGNDAPQGYGHMCISVPDIRAACARFERLGVPFHKKLGEGGMKEIAFIKDPDGYRYELVQPENVGAVLGN